ncbi:bestrophin-1 isoform X2 [Lasioglossum baleicum]
MHSIALYVTGSDEYARMLRRALMRYLNLSLILVLRSISSAVKKRFPTLEHVVDSGFMTSLELELFLAVPSLEFNTYWIPCTWFINLLKEARVNRRIPDAQGLKLIMEEFNEFRTKCGLLWSYDWISIPLVYTQVVTLATYSFFGVALIGRQYIEGNDKQFQLEIDIYVPVFTILQFFFFMGLLKVAEQLINPFGDDDEDFELNWIIDRHTKVSYLGVDTLMNRCPPLVKDIYFDAENLTLPYTEAAAAYKKKTYRGSVANMTVPEEKQTMFLPDVLEEDEEETRSLKQSLYTSNMSLATHNNDSPVCQRRQISLDPNTPTRTDQSCPETVLQFDLQEPLSQIDQTEDRSKIVTEAVTKFSKLPKHSSLRVDPNRKPFFSAMRSPKIVLQSSPSVSNLSQPTKQIIDTPAVYTGDPNPWGEYGPKVFNFPMSEASTLDQSPEVETQRDDPATFFDNFVVGTEDSPHPVTSQSRCHSVHHLQLPEADLSTLKTKSPRHIVRRHRSMEAPTRQGIQWKRMLRMQRKGTADDIPPIEAIMLETKSSPNLKHLDDNKRE